MPVSMRGQRELAVRFEVFPAHAHARIKERVTRLVDALEARSRDAAPHKSGLLQSEIRGRVYADRKDRVAGYVSVYAPDAPGEYPKAATLEFGTNKPRRIFKTGSALLDRLGRRRRRIVLRMTKPVHIAAFAYLRGPFRAMRPEIEAEIAAALADAAKDNSA